MTSLFEHRLFKTHGAQLSRFLLVGGIGFLCDLSSLRFFVEYFGIDPRYGVILSSCVGMAFVFIANKFFTFKNKEKTYSNQLFKFAVVYGTSLIFNIGISNVLLLLGAHYILAKCVAVGIGVIWNYAFSHGFIFRRSEKIDIVVS